jgi:hypothetical protein
MIRFLANVWAKLRYVFREELKAGENELNARAALQRVATITVEADALEANIKRRDEMEEKGFWECENGHEKGDAFIPGVEGAGRTCLDCKAPAKFISHETMSG